MAKKQTKSKSAPPKQIVGCRLMQLTKAQKLSFALKAHRINPMNHPARGGLIQGKMLDNVGLIAALTTAYWGPANAKLGVAFMDNPSKALRNKILKYANKWGGDGAAAIEFTEASLDNAQIRVARQQGEGYYSYLGVEALEIQKALQTLNLDSFTEATPDSEFDRVVTHEFGHGLGFVHEHLRRAEVEKLIVQATIRYFKRWQGWDRATTMAQVLTAVEEQELLPVAGFELTDESSVMCYPLPGEITKDGKPIIGGDRINAKDAAYAATIYPAVAAPGPTQPPTGGLPDRFTLALEIQGLKFSGEVSRN